MSERFLLLKGDAVRIPLPDQSVDLVFGSPPYMDARTYLEGGKNLSIARKCEAWIDWMVEVTLEAQRVCRGPVLWVAAGRTKQRNYHPAVEGLMYKWWLRGGDCHMYRPCYWHRVGISGSGSDQWFRSDVEHVVCFKRKGKLPYSNPTAMGKPCKYPPGGAMSHRTTNGKRVGKCETEAALEKAPKVIAALEDGLQPGSKFHSKRTEKGRRIQVYNPPKIANPGNLVKVIVGGGRMGSDLAHESEAPFPEALVEHFLRSLSRPGDIVLDPFSGSGTTVAVALQHDRRGIGMDLRWSQCDLGRRRVIESLNPEPVVEKVKRFKPLPGQRTFAFVEEFD